MANDRNRREDFDDYSGADPGRQRDTNEETGPAGGNDIRGIADEGDEDFDEMEELEDDDEGDE